MNGQQFAESLALCAGQCGLPNGVMGGGGTRCTDLMAALGKAQVPDVARRLVRLKWMIEPQSIDMIILSLIPDNTTERRTLALIALEEWLLPEDCLNCAGGKSNKLHEYLDGLCPVCGGTGQTHVTDEWRYSRFHVTKAEWGIWERHYLVVLDRVRDLERLCLNRSAALLTEYAEA